MAIASHLFDRRRLTRRLRLYWERTRPIRRPDYTPGTPEVSLHWPMDMYRPPTALTLAHAALSEEAARSVAAVLERLTPCQDLTLKQMLYQWAQDTFRGHWRYADLFTTLWAATLIRPASYLEIGVRRGWSAAVVGAAAPQCAIYGFDLWPPEYDGIANPGPGFVTAELAAAGHEGAVTLVSGDSHETIPDFLRRHPELYFDLITVDGDKTVRGVSSDLANVLPRLKVGGIVVCDDLAMVPTLRRVWEKLIERDGRYVHWEFRDAGSGVAAAIRVCDVAPVSFAEGLL